MVTTTPGLTIQSPATEGIEGSCWAVYCCGSWRSEGAKPSTVGTNRREYMQMMMETTKSTDTTPAAKVRDIGIRRKTENIIISPVYPLGNIIFNKAIQRANGPVG